jgi:hypothetical protein
VTINVLLKQRSQRAECHTASARPWNAALGRATNVQGDQYCSAPRSRMMRGLLLPALTNGLNQVDAQRMVLAAGFSGTIVELRSLRGPGKR